MERQSQNTENKPRTRTDEKHVRAGVIQSANEKNSSSKRNNKNDEKTTKMLQKVSK
jgi:hypothetical protein